MDLNSTDHQLPYSLKVVNIAKAFLDAFGVILFLRTTWTNTNNNIDFGPPRTLPLTQYEVAGMFVTLQSAVKKQQSLIFMRSNICLGWHSCEIWLKIRCPKYMDYMSMNKVAS
ncbi:hypothetical protein TNCV_4490881 [Trichonephila clavipes]|nr:hypothetical protein TNCV_4490881 [Trichonephila clavipes]